MNFFLEFIEIGCLNLTNWKSTKLPSDCTSLSLFFIINKQTSLVKKNQLPAGFPLRRQIITKSVQSACVLCVGRFVDCISENGFAYESRFSTIKKQRNA